MSQRNLQYILMKDESQPCQNVMAVLEYLRSNKVTFLHPQNIIENNFPDIINNTLPSIYLTGYNRYLVGEKAILVFLAFHSPLDHNYLTLRTEALKQFNNRAPTKNNV